LDIGCHDDLSRCIRTATERNAMAEVTNLYEDGDACSARRALDYHGRVFEDSATLWGQFSTDLADLRAE
jgi:hypothetical protein